MNLNGAKGKLVIIGGGEDKEGDCVILKEFIRLAGKAKARIIIMTVATGKLPEPMRKIIGNLSNTERVLVGLNLIVVG